MAEVAELALRDGYVRPDNLPRGECIMTSLYAEDGTQTGIRIDHADPRILISAEMIVQTAFRAHPSVELDLSRAAGDYVGAVLHIRGVNRTVIYRITEYVPAVHAYIAEWPD